jgi:uncharacterized membrane protein YfcA
MNFSLEIIIVIILSLIQSVFGVGLLLFGTPTFLMLGYDFPNTINILLPMSIAISFLQFFKSKVNDKKFIVDYNIYCLPLLILFLILALNFRDLINFKFYIAALLVISSLIILNKKRFSSFKSTFFKLKRLILIFIGCIHGFTNMGGSFLSIYSTIISKNKKELSRYYISYGYLVMGVIQYFIVLLFTFNHLDFSKIFYVLITISIYLPAQKLFKDISDIKFSKIINIIALFYGIIILVTNVF